jgi:hypothetical protein
VADPVYLTDYITTDAMLQERKLLARHTINSLTHSEMRENTVAPGPWAPWHVEAWRVIKERLRNQRVPIDGETDVDADGISQLTVPALSHVVYQAYRAAGKRDEANDWLKIYEKELNAATTRLSLTGGGEAQAPVNRTVSFRRV